MTDVRNLTIIGSGPAGLTAAIYGGRANLKPVLFAGTAWGGQLMQTTEVENYPGFVDGILGPELMQNFRKQAERFGTEIIDQDVVRVDFSSQPFTVASEGHTARSRAVIIATGASTRWLGLPSESKLRGHGVSSCATCDGFFFRNQDIAVIGGGDTAMEEALYLTKFGRSVTVIHRSETLRASKIQVDRVKQNPKISFLLNTVAQEFLGDTKLTGIRIKDVKTGSEEVRAFGGAFVAIGFDPNTGLFKGQLELDARGYIVPRENSQTSAPGVFVSGDVHDHRYRQAVTAAGSGCRALLDAEQYLSAFRKE
jgi:thioredoxin reductase (NADPH)